VVCMSGLRRLLLGGPVLAGLVLGCDGSNDVRMSVPQQPELQGISFLGDSLFSSPSARTVEVQTPLLAEARATLEAGPNTAENWIWVGRRLAYLGEFQVAIEVFSEGVRRFPEDARFLRHRGHRYLSVRETDKAVADFRKAIAMIAGTENKVEPDGLPNAIGEPQSSLHRNIWYHLALAHFINGNYEQSHAAWLACIGTSRTDDSRVACTYWMYLTLHRLGRVAEARSLLLTIWPGMEIVSNQPYLELMLLFKGQVQIDEVQPAEGQDPKGSTTLYGLANWYQLNEREEEAQEILDAILANKTQWGAFGYITAEADRARGLSLFPR